MRAAGLSLLYSANLPKGFCGALRLEKRTTYPFAGRTHPAISGAGILTTCDSSSYRPEVDSSCSRAGMLAAVVTSLVIILYQARWNFHVCFPPCRCCWQVVNPDIVELGFREGDGEDTHTNRQGLSIACYKKLSATCQGSQVDGPGSHRLDWRPKVLSCSQSACCGRCLPRTWHSSASDGRALVLRKRLLPRKCVSTRRCQF